MHEKYVYNYYLMYTKGKKRRKICSFMPLPLALDYLQTNLKLNIPLIKHTTSVKPYLMKHSHFVHI